MTRITEEATEPRSPPPPQYELIVVLNSLFSSPGVDFHVTAAPALPFSTRIRAEYAG